jgi:hypothetical protein
MGEEEEELKKYIKKNKLNQKGRKRNRIDRKSYLIGYLYHYWFYTEEKIAAMFNIDRSSVNHHKNKIFDFKKDINFIMNTCMERELYPIDYDAIKDSQKMDFRKTFGYGITFIKLEREQYLKLKEFMDNNNIENTRKVIPKLIDTFL